MAIAGGNVQLPQKTTAAKYKILTAYVLAGFFVASLLLFPVNAQAALLDDMTTAPNAAYGLRKLKDSYSGSAIQIRRDSDDTTLDVGFDAQGDLDTTAITDFVTGTDDAYVTIWYDQSGNGNNAVQAGSSSNCTGHATLCQPRIVLNGTVETHTVNSVERPVILFGATSGTAATALNATGVSVSQPDVISIVASSANANLGANAIDASHSTNLDTPANTYRQVINNGLTGAAANSNVYYYAGGTFQNSGDSWGTALRQVSGYFNGASSKLYMDSTEILTGVNPGTVGLTGLRIGAYKHNVTASGASGNLMWNGDIAEVIVYANATTATLLADRAIVDNDQAIYYGIIIDPEPPADLYATAVNSSSILLQWQGVDNGALEASDYVIEYKATSSGVWSTFSDGTSAARGVIVTGLSSNTSYDFRVSGVISGVTGDPSATVSATTTSSGNATIDYYNHVISTGQSLSIGQTTGGVLTTTQPFDNQMLNSTYTALTDLIEPGTGAYNASTSETPWSGAANMLTDLVDSTPSYKSIITMSGVSGTAYSGLAQDTAPYTNSIDRLKIAMDLSVAASTPFRATAVTTVHGESDEIADKTAAEYQASLEEWQSDYETDIKAVTGQTGTIPLFIDQMHSWNSPSINSGDNTQSTGVVIGQWEAAKDNPTKIFLVTPKYIFDYQDNLHLKHYSSRRLGEYYGKVMHQVLHLGNSWLPLSPETITFVGNKIYAKFHVPCENMLPTSTCDTAHLAFDTTLVNSETNYGFEYTDDSSSATISSVGLLAGTTDTVEITMSGTPTGTNKKLRYAYTASATDAQPGRGITGSPKGNLRDTDQTPAYYQTGVTNLGYTLYNWAITFNEAISAATAPDAPTIGTATPGDTEVSVAFTAPANNGGAPITGYTVTAYDGGVSTGLTGTGSSSPITVTGLTNGTAYTFRVTATNAVGTSSSSADSNSATPVQAAGITITESGGTTAMTEGSTDSFTVVLDSQPTTDVVLSVTSSDSGAASVSAATLTFTNGNWDSAQTITVTGASDADVSNESATITISVVDASSDNAYDALADETVSVSVTDDDTAALTVTQSGGTTAMTEGSTDSFTVALATQPSTDVVLSVSSNDTGAATVSAATLTFTNGNYSSAQTITVTGVSDGDISNETPTITISVVDGSSDNTYDAVADSTVNVTVTDDDSAGLTVTQSGGTTAMNEGSTDSFTVALTSQPATDVVLAVSSNDTGAATVSAATLTFTNGNWSSAQTITVTGVADDDGVDETPTITISVNDGSSDNTYDAVADSTVNVSVNDDDTPGFFLEESSDVYDGEIPITEGAAELVFISLTTEPASDVRVTMTSSDSSKLSLFSEEFFFTSSDWDTPQILLFSGEEDADANDENETITFSIDDTSSADEYDSVADEVANVSISDNDTPGLTVTQSGGTTAMNEGSTDSFTVALNTQPSTDVVLSISSNDTGAATVSSSTLTFTNSNWNSAQTITVTGVQDADISNETPTITISVNDGSSDNTYDAVADSTVNVTVTDDDSAGLTVTQSGGTTAMNEGSTDSFTVALATQPSTDVVLSVSSNDTGAATVSAATLTFTNGNYSTPQTITVTGVQDDDASDETSTVTVSVVDASSDNTYDAVADSTVSVSVNDDDTPGLVVEESDSITLLDEGDIDSFTVVLTTEPATDVVIDLEVDDPTAISLSVDALTFTNGNWDTPQTVTVTGEVDDDIIDETPFVAITVNDASSDNTYDDVADTGVGVTVTDTTIAGLTVTQSGGTTAMTEGSTDSFTVALAAQPSTDVVLSVSSNDTGAATVSAATLTFTNSNYSSAQTVTVTGVQDADISNETPTITIAVVDGSSDDAFDAVSNSTVNVTVTDDDSAGLTVTQSGGTTAMTEGSTDSFTVALTTQPSTDVVLSVSSNDTGAATVSASTLTFTNSNWSSAQTITVTGVQDADTSNETPTITISVTDASSDDTYDAVADSTVSVTVTDDDTAGLTVTQSGGTTAMTEGSTDSFTVALNTQPATDVVLSITSNDTGAATVSASTLTFTNSNYSTPQTITVTGVQDGDISNETPTITISVTDASSDDAYDAVADSTVSVTVTDDDSAGLTVTQSGGTTAMTEGSTDSFTVALNAQPTTDVVLSITSSDTGAATVSAATLTFTNGNYSSAQTITVTGVSDADTSNETLTITISVVDASSDDSYDAVADSTVNVTVTDDDAAGLTVTQSGGTTAMTEGSTDSFTVALTTEPSLDVVLSVTSNDTGAATVSASTLTFTNSNYSSAQTITVTGVEDADGTNETPTITISVVDGSSDDTYDAVSDSTVNVTVTDNDSPGLTVTQSGGTTAMTEGSTDSFTVALTTEPSTDVVLSVTSNDTDAATVSASTLTFTNGNYSSAQTITVTGVSDADGDNETPTITISVVDGSSDDAYDSVSDSTVNVSVTDDDAPGLTVTQSSGSTEMDEGSTDSFTVALTTQPATDVVLSVASSDSAAASVSAATLTFTNGNYSTPQTITVTGEDDADTDDETPTITISVTDASSDDTYDGVADSTVNVTVNDDDAPADSTAPVISNISADPDTTSVVITWTTDEASSSIVEYGPDTSYGTTTSEADTSPRVTSHSVSISSLSSSTTYHYRVKSNDASSNLGTSSDQTFTTDTVSSGGGGGGGSRRRRTTEEAETPAVPVVTDTTQVPATPTVTPDVPATSGASIITITSPLKQGDSSSEIKKLQQFLNNNGFTVALAGPGSKGLETNYFGPATRAALMKYQEAYKAQILVPGGFTSATGMLGPLTVAHINAAMQSTTPTAPVVVPVTPAPSPAVPNTSGKFTAYLRKGMTHPEVKKLQQFLNSKGYVIASSGPGSVGQETNLFGPATEAALIRFQNAHKNETLIPAGVTEGTGVFGRATREYINSLIP